MDYWFQELPNQAKMPMPDRGLHLEGDAGWFSGSPPTTVLWVGAPGLWVGALAFSAPPLLATAPAGMGSARENVAEHRFAATTSNNHMSCEHEHPCTFSLPDSAPVLRLNSVLQ